MYLHLRKCFAFVCIVPDLTVTISPPGPIQGAIVGDHQVINCIVSTVSGVDPNLVLIIWLDPEGNSVIPDGRVTISDTTPIGDGNFARSLIFTFLMEGVYGDEGNYTCDAMILDASGTDSFVIGPLTGQYTVNMERLAGLNFQFSRVP